MDNQRKINQQSIDKLLQKGKELAKEMNIGIGTVYKIINREYSVDYKKGLK